jgi:hypothetical protein
VVGYPDLPIIPPKKIIIDESPAEE